MVCFFMDPLTKKCRQIEPEEAWSEDFTCPLPAMDLSQGKREIIKMMMPMSMAGLTLRSKFKGSALLGAGGSPEV